jgi:hypothetical protein
MLPRRHKPVKGEAVAEGPTGQEENPVQSINAITTAASSDLKLGSDAASLTGSALLKLATDLGFNFVGERVFISPAKPKATQPFKFPALNKKLPFKVINHTSAKVKISGKINPNEVNFKITGGSGCLGGHEYNPGVSCVVQIEVGAAGQTGAFEVVPTGGFATYETFLAS